MTNQANQQDQQRIQQLEAAAKHYTQAANALRNQNEQECNQHIQQAQQAAQQVQQATSQQTR